MRSLERGRCWGREKNGNRRGGAFSISTSTLDIVGCLVLFFDGEFVVFDGRARPAARNTKGGNDRGYAR